ncbi:MAG: family 1 encapsulin nanocompartment shell protein [Synergistaceae bacterium]|nr:family 1 encapsulin nanocompartment shell protein [Synergistaceae bacterium]
MDILKRSLAPIFPAAWNEIDEQAQTVLKNILTGRKIVDVKGPLGWNCDAVSEGTLSLVEESPVEGVNYGIRESLPLVEIRVPFTVSMWDLDDISRNSKTVDLTSVIEAARQAALFEDTAVFQGLEEAGILGLELEADNEPVEIKLDDESIISALVEAMLTLGSRSMEGPYALVCTLPLWTKIRTSAKGYPLLKRVKDVLGDDGRIVLSPQYETSMLVSMKEGSSELIIGQDFSIGYQSHTNTEVNFFITETFTFRVLAPESIVPFKIAE